MVVELKLQHLPDNVLPESAKEAIVGSSRAPRAVGWCVAPDCPAGRSTSGDEQGSALELSGLAFGLACGPSGLAMPRKPS